VPVPGCERKPNIRRFQGKIPYVVVTAFMVLQGNRGMASMRSFGSLDERSVIWE